MASPHSRLLLASVTRVPTQSVVQKMLLIFRAAEEGDLKYVKALIHETGPMMRRANNQCTLLHIAVSNNQLEIAKFLLRYISPNVINKDKQTPAHLAAMEGFTEILKILVADHRFNPEVKDLWQRTYKDWLAAPLFEAILLGSEYHTKSLLDLGANPDYHAGSCIEFVTGNDLDVTTARELAFSLGNKNLIAMLPKFEMKLTAMSPLSANYRFRSCQVYFHY